MFPFFKWYLRCLRSLIPGADSSPIIRQTASFGYDYDYDYDYDVVAGEIFDSPFDRLPGDVAGKIFGNLCIGDRVRTRLVCKSWRDMLTRADFPVKPEAPWLILFNGSYSEPREYPLTEEICFESTTEERVYRFKLPNYSVLGKFCGGWRWCCCGSSSKGGWLLMAGCGVGPWRDLSGTVMLLWDPISGTTRKLPALSTLPFFSELVGGCIRAGTENISVFIDGAQVFSVGSVDQCVVGVIFSVGSNLDHQLALCSPQDQSWSVVGTAGGVEFTDILFHDGKLYASCIYSNNNNNNNNGGKSSCSIVNTTIVQLGCCDVEVIIMLLMYEEDDHHHVEGHVIPVGFSIHERCTLAEHLVESSTTGELLVVSAILDLCKYNDNMGGHRTGPIQSFICTQTRGFEVRRLYVNADGLLCCSEKMSHIGEQCIFVGDSGSTSVDGVDGVVELDCIHFATNDADGRICIDDDDDEQDYDELEDAFDPNRYIVHERGMFDVGQNRINRTSLTNLRVRSGSATGWFTPKLLSNKYQY